MKISALLNVVNRMDLSLYFQMASLVEENLPDTLAFMELAIQQVISRHFLTQEINLDECFIMIIMGVS